MTQADREEFADLRAVVGPDRSFVSAWLHGKSVAPIPAGSCVDAALVRRIAAGCRAVGSSRIVWGDLSGDTPVRVAVRRPVDQELANVRPPSLFCTLDQRGAVLFPVVGYALIAGTDAFMAAAVGEGMDTVRTRFARYAGAVSDRHPDLPQIANTYPPARHAWSRPADVVPGSGAARQLALLEELSDGVCSPVGFANGWWDARRTSQRGGERVRGALADLFDRVFMILEDYAVDPSLREPGDLTDAELRSAVLEVWKAFLLGE